MFFISGKLLLAKFSIINYFPKEKEVYRATNFFILNKICLLHIEVNKKQYKVECFRYEDIRIIQENI